MTFSWIDDKVASMPHTTVEYRADWDVTIYRLTNKMIGLLTRYKDGRPLLTLKLPPDQGDLLRETFSYVIPGYLSNKKHYNSVFLDTEVTQEFVEDLLEDAWQCVFATLPKKTQRLINGE